MIVPSNLPDDASTKKRKLGNSGMIFVARNLNAWKWVGKNTNIHEFLASSSSLPSIENAHDPGCKNAQRDTSNGQDDKEIKRKENARNEHAYAQTTISPYFLRIFIIFID